MSPHPRHSLAILISLAALATPPAARADDASGAKETPLAPAAPAAQAKPTPPSKSAIDALVKQLSHDDWKLREKAQADLARFGPEAVPTLEALLAETKDPELRARAETARADGRLVGVGLACVVEPSISNMGYITLAQTAVERAAPLPKSGNAEGAAVAVDPLGSVSCPPPVTSHATSIAAATSSSNHR